MGKTTKVLTMKTFLMHYEFIRLDVLNHFSLFACHGKKFMIQDIKKYKKTCIRKTPLPKPKSSYFIYLPLKIDRLM